MKSVPKEYENVRRFYNTKYGPKMGSEMFDAYMMKRRKNKTVASVGTVALRNAVVVPWIPTRTVYQKMITRRRGTNLVIKRKS